MPRTDEEIHQDVTIWNTSNMLIKSLKYCCCSTAQFGQKKADVHLFHLYFRNENILEMELVQAVEVSLLSL